MLELEHPEHPDITEEMWKDVDKIIDEHYGQPGCIIAVLRKSQSVVGYLPAPLMDYISAGLNLPRSDVFGVASFYSLFSLEPKGRHVIKVCTGTACYVKGIREVISRISNKYNMAEGCTSADRCFSLESVRCLGACGLAPVMVIGENVHGAVKADTVLDILQRYE
ncbi:MULTISPECIES: complex I 24 kDa subunit family protein [Desulfococcus]|uniref:NADH dehydrogenase (Ubiquinone) 24 kDa subunit n=1 Tax=Desulfococcus multivorans DSM 2059 TaxID=1121405 RepID=S7UZL5_DESML|nr:NAD(P)H-dependent oxidoreductase subunit E [Desulfococcus multivorans]AOY59633.1 NuoE3: NADH quinone oxidoreductase, subunit E [Desulfococcus multivorans]AQV01823.1 NAD(P)H-dependent oxidoreductase subunit E [Desulfococcus multivorans]EPR37878.1 NADH dehydrogenase (ubiquinone) 24 kDa subunit [Desulfococcus multivorans DSM 2059]SKA16240.1 NADH dehydrogenase subunit E [Desulfococcus multivorans DSM 2059]